MVAKVKQRSGLTSTKRQRVTPIVAAVIEDEVNHKMDQVVDTLQQKLDVYDQVIDQIQQVYSNALQEFSIRLESLILYLEKQGVYVPEDYREAAQEFNRIRAKMKVFNAMPIEARLDALDVWNKDKPKYMNITPSDVRVLHDLMDTKLDMPIEERLRLATKAGFPPSVLDKITERFETKPEEFSQPTGQTGSDEVATELVE